MSDMGDYGNWAINELRRYDAEEIRLHDKINALTAERDHWKRLAGGHCETCMDQSCVRLKEEKYSDALAKIKGKP